jgi:hypothetical protein
MIMEPTLRSCVNPRRACLVALCVAAFSCQPLIRAQSAGEQPVSGAKSGVAGGSESAPTAVVAEPSRRQSPEAPPPLSPATVEILKMMEAGVSMDVIRAYIENAQMPAQLSAEDVITLKRRGVPDDITTALLKHGAEVRRRNAQAGASAVPTPNSSPVRVAPASPAYGGLDPDSYAYFYHYYLQPRAMASAYRRLGLIPLGVYTPGGPSFSFGFPPPWRFGP